LLLLITILLPIAGYFAIKQETAVASLTWLPITLFIIPIIFIFFLLVRRNADWQRIIAAIAGLFFLLNSILLFYVYPTLYKQNPVAKTIDMVKKSPLVLSYQIYNPGYNFYLGNNIKIYNSIDSLDNQLRQDPEAIIISRKEFIDSLKTLNVDVIAEHRDLFELPTTIILKRHANH
jgi:hypothetical protein